jgi:hypothetical protein
MRFQAATIALSTEFELRPVEQAVEDAVLIALQPATIPWMPFAAYRRLWYWIDGTMGLCCLFWTVRRIQIGVQNSSAVKEAGKVAGCIAIKEAMRRGKSANEG